MDSDIHGVVEKYLTSGQDIDQILKENKERIQTITQALQDIMNAGYFDILNSAQDLVDLANSQDCKASLSIPEPVKILEKPDMTEKTEISEIIWRAVDCEKYFEAIEMIIKEIEKERSEELIDILIYICDPKQRSLFLEDEEKTREWLAGFTLIIKNFEKLPELDFEIGKYCEGDLSESLCRFWLEQFSICLKQVTDKSSIDDIQKIFSKAISVLKYEFHEGKLQDFLANKSFDVKIHLENTSKISDFILKDSLEAIKPHIVNIIQNTQDLKKLMIFLTNREKSDYGIPDLWDIIKDDWQEKLKNITIEALFFLNNLNAEDSEKDFEKRTEGIVEILMMLKTEEFADYFEELREECIDKLKEELKKYENKLYVACLLHHLQTSKFVNTLFQEIAQFSELQEDYLMEWIENSKNKSDFEVAREVRKMCGDDTFILKGKHSSLLEISEDRKLFADILGLQISEKESESISLPEKKPRIERLQLPPRFIPHLIQA
ncbi:unnamed protein product [Blepharisma stoltei]|uniref:Uncharacterized protein n=1 Tax=Blepharisma stoltei TaxID=1481888 RepID=A0AAU9J9T7_9CILI|nr:unnamed protein product [Blepharisma stoltei]